MEGFFDPYRRQRRWHRSDDTFRRSEEAREIADPERRRSIEDDVFSTEADTTFDALPQRLALSIKIPPLQLPLQLQLLPRTRQLDPQRRGRQNPLSRL